MKKALRGNGRKVISIILTCLLVLGMTTTAFAGWATYNGTSYNSGNVYLEEVWFGTQQIIHYYANGELTRSAASEGNTFWIGTWPVLDNLYDTGYWCFDRWGNIFLIDKAQNLLLSRVGTTTFVVNTSVIGATGFQRDNGKIGYLVYTNNGSYSLEELLRGNNFNTNFNYNNNYYNYNNNYNNSYVPTIPVTPTVPTYYPYVYENGSMLFYYENSSRYICYSYEGSTLSFKGINNTSSNYVLSNSVTDVTFNIEGNTTYIVYADRNGNAYRYPIGKTSNSYRQRVGKNVSYFVKYDYMSSGYYNKNGIYQEFYVMDEVDNDGYPRVKKSGNTYYYYTSANKYQKYSLSSYTLYDKGTNSNSKNTKLASNVEEIIFSDEGYIIYATKNGDVYAYPIGKTASNYREDVGEDFEDFDDYDDDYMSDGYYDRYDDWIDFDF